MSYSMTSILGCVRSLQRSWNHIGLIRELSTGLGVTESMGRGAMRKPALRSGVLVSVGVRGKMQLLGASLALLVFCLPIFSQVNTGRILGTVSDQTGGVIAGASVALTNVDTGVARNVTTDTAGEYNAPNLPPGNYAVHATAMGFQALDRRGVVVQIGTDVRIDVQLVPGQITQTVEVTESIPLLDTTSATIGGTLNTQTIADLPMNGRNYQRLLILQPGQFQRAGGGTDTQESNGLRAEDSNYYVEGLDNNEPFYGQSVVNSSLPSGDAATILPIDAIQEFNVENNPPAEFGRKAGAVVNVGLKSGTNSIHGAAYAFGRDDAMDARNFFNPPPRPVSPLNFEQWGGTVGGPIKKDKLFYYAGFERTTYTVGNSFTASLPSTADFTANGAPNGTKFSIPDAEAALTGHSFSVSPLSTSLLSLYGANSALTNNAPSGFPNDISIYNVLGKVDYHPNDHNTINGSYFRGHGNGLSQDSPQLTQLAFRTTATLLTQFVTASWTWAPNSTWVNDFRGGWTYYDESMFTDDHNVAPTTYGLNTGVTDPLLFGFPNILVAGLTTLGGGSHWPQVHGPSDDYDLVDAVSYLHGKHAFKFGADIFHFYSPNFFDAAGRGSFSFNAGTLFPGSTGLEAFLAGVPTLGKLEVGSPIRDMKQWMYSVFAEDVWRATNHVTVNLGLRWEDDSPVTAVNNLISNWTPTTGLQQAGINSVNGSAVYNPDYKDFSPRIGLAWDLGGKGTTVVRAGYGIYYTTPPLASYIGNPNFSDAPTTGINSNPTGFSVVVPSSPASPVLGTVQPALTNGTIAAAAVQYPGSALTWVPAPGGPIFPATGTSGSAFKCGNGIGANPTPCPIFAVNTNFVNPMISMWNLGVQHSLTSNLSVEASYVGNHSKRLPGVIDINQAPPGSQSAASCPLGNAAQCLQIARPYFTQYPYISNINYLTNLDTSNYNALQARVTERNYHNLSLLIGYTYSHALDDMSHYFGPSLPESSFAPYASYGNSDFDLRHHFTIALTYTIPGRKGFGQLLEGWSLNSVVTLQSGLPWNVGDGTDNFSQTGEFADRWNFFGNPKDFTANLNPIPFFPGGSATMPAACTSNAAATGATAVLATSGCYAEGGSVMIPPARGTFGTMGRNIFRDSGYRDWDLSVFKNFKFKERLTAQFRAEFFNVLNRPNFANPGLGGTTDPSGGQFGAESSTPDVAADNPVLGTGGPREIQLGLKLLF